MRNDARLLLLDRDAVGELLDMSEASQAVRTAFELHGRRGARTFPVIREALPGGGIFGIKAGDVPDQGLLGLKAAGFWPSNRECGGEPHQATIMLFDPETGRPHCLIDGNAITTVRTGAAGALGLEVLARKDSETLTVFGTGVQARIQLDFALRVLPRLQGIFYVSANRQPNSEFEARYSARCDFQCAVDPDAAVAQSDVIITATPGGGPLFDANSVCPGTHINCVGADTRGKRELPEHLLDRARVFVDDAQQAAQLGEMQWVTGIDSTELGSLLTGQAALIRAPDDVTVFDMTGLAVQDVVVAQLVYTNAISARVGHSVSWPW